MDKRVGSSLVLVTTKELRQCHVKLTGKAMKSGQDVKLIESLGGKIIKAGYYVLSRDDYWRYMVKTYPNNHDIQTYGADRFIYDANEYCIDNNYPY